MKNNKLPGTSGVMTDMMNNLPFEFLTYIIQAFWKNKEVDFDSWHITKLSNLYKGMGDQQDPNNWHGICLKQPKSSTSSS